MAKQFDGKTCVFCPRPSSRGGEHVWPQWFLDMFPPEEGPYTSWVNGEPVLKRNGDRRAHPAMGRVKLPACIACNAELFKRFEKPAKELIRELMTPSGSAIFEDEAATIVSLWFLKTWLLLAHPKARDSEPGITPSRWHSVSEDLWTWMVNDQPPPAGLSVWVARIGDSVPNVSATRHVPLPTVVADGREVEFMSMRAGVRFLDVSLAYHPGWEINHPLEVEGRALRLWPRNPDEPADFGSLPSVNPKDTSWLKGPRLQFSPGTFPSPDLPPLSADLNLMMDLPLRFLQGASW